MKLRNLVPKNLLKENRKYDYGCVMLYFDLPVMSEIHGIIDEVDVYKDENDPSFGLEDEPHCTLLFGLHKEVTLEQVRDVLSTLTFGESELSHPSIFSNDEYDVLKYDVSGPSLHEANKKLKEYPFTSNFPDYHPHCTIGYLHKRCGQRYADILEHRGYESTTVIPTKAVYSQPDGTKTDIPISLTEAGNPDYYKNNPEARKKKQEYDAKFNKKPEQVKKRVETNKARREATKAGKNIKGKDASHTKSGIRFKDSSKNRGSKSDQPGDKRARGGKKKK